MVFRLMVGVCVFSVLVSTGNVANSESPTTAYVFPPGGQRGTTVPVRIGGHFLHDKADFLIVGPGVEGRSPIEQTSTTWFEGPLILQPASQQKEDYPKDYAGEIQIAADAPLGVRYWHCTTSQGITPGMRFVISDLPEIVEEESEENVPSKPLTLPVTINGRIFPREDVDDWTLDAKAGQVITCEVNAARIGSGLDSRLEVLGPNGQVIAENSDTFGLDSFVRFKAPSDGKYMVRIHDIRFEGLQHFVYRLTISSGPWLDRVYPLGGKRGEKVPLQLFGANLANDRLEFVLPNSSGATTGLTLVSVPVAGGTTNALFESDEWVEHLESEPNNEVAEAKMVELPCVLNGRIEQPGDSDLWTFTGKKGDSWQFDLRASRLGSELDGVLTLLDANGNAVANADDLANGQTDCLLNFTLPADGTFTLKVRDGLSSRGGPEYTYRVRITRPGESTLRLSTAMDAITLLRGGETKIKVLAERPVGFADEVSLAIEGLPEGVTATGKLGKGQNQVDLILKADAATKISTSHLRIVGKCKVGEQELSAIARIQRTLSEAESPDLLLRIAVATPFKLKGIFETKYAPRGTTFTRRYQVERNGFEGPLWVEIADRQARHLQGVTGPKVSLAAGVSEFEYPFTLPPHMEIGRTSRTCLAVFGEVADADGTKHVVSHTSVDQNEQCIVLIDPNRLSVETTLRSIRREPGSEIRLPFRVARGNGLRGPVRVELLVPKTVPGVLCDPVDVPEGSNSGALTLRFAAQSEGKNSTKILKLRVSMSDETGWPVTDEAEIRLAQEP